MIVSNSTSLIALSKIGKFELLREYFGVVHIPKEVYDEVVTRGKNLFGAVEVKDAEWIKVEEVIKKRGNVDKFVKVFIIKKRRA